MQEQTQTSSSRSNNCLLIILLIVLGGAAILYLIAQAGEAGGQGSSFDAAPYTLQIAQPIR
jgi:hypothetical protein